jgi:hypothetical protein
MPTNKTKISFLFLLAIFTGLLLASPALAAIVPCGGPSTADTGMCTLCHLIVGIDNIFKYAFLIFVGIALVMMVVAGIMYITSAGNTGMMESAKKLMKNALAGFALVLLAWLIVNYTMILISAKSDLGVGATNWYTFTCNTTPAPPPTPPPTPKLITDTCTDFTYSDWTTCINGNQNRVITSYIPPNCTGGKTPELTQGCTAPTPPVPVPPVPPVPVPSTCTSFTYSDWSDCQNKQQIRTVTSSTPAGCTGGNRILKQACGGITGTKITNPIPLAMGPFGTMDYNTNPFQPGEKRYYIFTYKPDPSQTKHYILTGTGCYDQKPIQNMVLEKGEAIDYFDYVYNYYATTPIFGNPSSWGYDFIKTINNTQVWATMLNDPFGQQIVVRNPPAGTYYLIVKNMDTTLTSRINVVVNGQ